MIGMVWLMEVFFGAIEVGRHVLLLLLRASLTVRCFLFLLEDEGLSRDILVCKDQVYA